MIYYVKGDLFSSSAQVIVNTVNTQGVMGKGIARDFKALYPEMFRAYQQLCEGGKLEPGTLHLYRTSNKWVLNFPTKRHWRQKSRLDDIELGLDTFLRHYQEMQIFSVAFPQLGCGNGELDWEGEVRPLMEHKLTRLPIDIFIHTYDSAQMPEHRDIPAFKRWLRGEPESLAFDEFWNDIHRQVTVRPDMTVAFQEVVSAAGEAAREPSIEILTTAGDTASITKPQLLQLWQQFRQLGLLAKSDLPDSLGSGRDLFWSMLHALDYVAPTAFAAMADIRSRRQPTATSLESTDNEGLRLVPYKITGDESGDTQLCLFDKMAV